MKKFKVFLLLMVLTATHVAGAATLLVYNNNDNGAGSLRQAINDNHALGGGSTIGFSNVVVGTIALTGGQLLIRENVTISGPGPDVLTLSAGVTNRVIEVTNPVVVNLSGLSLVGGNLMGPPYQGGGIRNAGTLMLSNCVVANCTGAIGGGIFNAGPLVIVNSILRNNSSSTGAGGILNFSSLTLVGSSIVSNAVNGSMDHSAINGGAIVMTNCTVAWNTGGSFGAVWGVSGSIIWSCTISKNESSGVGSGCLLGNSVIADNGTFSDVFGGFTSAGYNFIGRNYNATGFGSLGDQVGTQASPLNPNLLPLGRYGSAMPTMPPAPGSPLIDQGKSFGLGTDERGRTRPYDYPGVPNATGGDGSDIGAVELSPSRLLVTTTNDNGPGSLRQVLAGASTAEVDTVLFSPNVTNTIALTTGELALTSSVNISGPGASLLAVSGNNTSTVFDILSGTINISGLTIRNGRAAGFGGNTEQNGFDGRGGGIFNQGALALTGCNVVSNSVVGGQGGPTDANTAGNGAAGLGGGIYNIGPLSLADCVIGYNTAVGGAGGQAGSGFAGGAGNAEGGGICSIATTLSLTRCSFLADAATGGVGGVATGGGFPGNGGQGYGGALYTDGLTTVTNCIFSGSSALAGTGGGGSGSGTGGGLFNNLNLKLFGCTVASNSAAGSSFDFGGGIYDQGTNLFIRCSTIAGNRAEYGGGLDSAGSAADLGNTILAGNSVAPGGSGPDCEGTIFSSDYNLIQNTSGATISGATTHNILGQNPLLGPLQNNGGPTFTLALLPGSPAIDKGKSFGAATDQRGRPRVYDFPTIANAAGGDGSDIGAFELTPPVLAIVQAGKNVLVSWPATDNGYTLQNKSSLSASVLWNTLPGSPAVVAGRFTVTNSSASGNGFYRLKSP